MPPKELPLDIFDVQPPLLEMDYSQPLSRDDIFKNHKDIFDGVFGASALDAALDFALDAISTDIAIEKLVEDMGPVRKKRFQDFIDNYVGDINPIYRQSIDNKLPNTAHKTPYGEFFDYSLPCMAVLDPKTGTVIVVSKDKEKDSKRANCWKVVQYDIFEVDPKKAVTDMCVQNVITIPADASDAITLDIVGPDSQSYIDFYLQLHLLKENYSRDDTHPVTLMQHVPYGKKPIVKEFPIDVGILCEKINIENKKNSVIVVTPHLAQQDITQKLSIEAA